MKRKTIKKLLCLAIAVAMTTTTLVGCGKGDGSGAGVANNKIVEEQAKKYADVTDLKEVTDGVKLTVAVPSNAKVLDFNTNNQTKMIEKEWSNEKLNSSFV